MRHMKGFLIFCLVFYIGCAAKSRFPQAKDIVEFKANPVSNLAHYKDFRVERRDLEQIINTYHQIPEEYWHHSYHHIAMNDVTGIIKLKDGIEIEWLVRPGGLATLTYPDGQMIFLAKEITFRGEE